MAFIAHNFQNHHKLRCHGYLCKVHTEWPAVLPGHLQKDHLSSKSLWLMAIAMNTCLWHVADWKQIYVNVLRKNDKDLMYCNINLGYFLPVACQRGFLK